MAKAKTRKSPKSKTPARPAGRKAEVKTVTAKKVAKPIAKPSASAKPVRRVNQEKQPQPAATSVAAPTPQALPKSKNISGLTKRDLEHYRELLVAKRRELLGDVRSLEDEALQNGPGVGNLSNLPDHMADQGTDNYEQEFSLGLMEKDRQVLREINLALEKIQKETYGICEGTGKPIGKPRLEAKPWARYSIEHALRLEKKSLGGVI